MGGLLGTRAGLQADLNLIFRVVILLLVIVGYLFATKHGLQWKDHGYRRRYKMFSIFVVMAPSIVINVFPRSASRNTL